MFTALPAEAAVAEDGTQYCGGSTPFSYVHFKTLGHRSWIAPGSTQHTESGSSSTWYTCDRQGVNGGGYWFAVGSINLSQPSTYGVCRNYG